MKIAARPRFFSPGCAGLLQPSCSEGWRSPGRLMNQRVAPWARSCIARCAALAASSVLTWPAAAPCSSGCIHRVISLR